jgi:hypothetical protein
LTATKRRSRLAVAAACLCCLLALAPAAAGALSLKGSVRGDPNAKVSMTIVKRHGEPKLIRQLWFKRLDHKCTDGAEREYSRRFPGRIEIDRLLTGKYNFFALAELETPPPLSPGSYFVSGEIRRSANRATVRKIASTIRFPSTQPSGETTCIADVENVALKR